MKFPKAIMTRSELTQMGFTRQMLEKLSDKSLHITFKNGSKYFYMTDRLAAYLDKLTYK